MVCLRHSLHFILNGLERVSNYVVFSNCHVFEQDQNICSIEVDPFGNVQALIYYLI